jgi:UTP:GlnB (protein PII) uridylyltransferase
MKFWQIFKKEKAAGRTMRRMNELGVIILF